MTVRDPTIPRHDPRARGMRGYQRGKFVDRGEGGIVFTSADGDVWPSETVTILQGPFGWNEDGFDRLPRAWVYDAAGKVVVEGDVVIFGHLNGSARTPVVLGAVHSSRATGFIRARRAGADRNRVAARVRCLNGLGTQTGELRIEGNPGDDGELRVAATHRLRMQVAPSIEDADAGLRLDMATAAEFTRGGTAQPVILGATFLGDLQTFNTALTAFLTTCSTATTAVQVAAAAATFLPLHQVWATKVATSVSGSAAPHLSTVLKSE